MRDTSTVFVVDDDATVRDTLQALLFTEGYHLEFASSRAESLARLEDVDPDVILLDVMMPDMDGFEICNILKQMNTGSIFHYFGYCSGQQRRSGIWAQGRRRRFFI